MFKNRKVDALYKYLGLEYSENWNEARAVNGGGVVSTHAHNFLNNDFRAIMDYLGIQINRTPAPIDGQVRTVIKKNKTTVVHSGLSDTANVKR